MPERRKRTAPSGRGKEKNMSDTIKTCANCRYYRKVEIGYYGRPIKTFFECDGPAASYVEASADDDSGLNSSYQPPPTFSCAHWALK